MSDIFREVDEALQREKAEKLWKNHGPSILWAALVLILATGATTAYHEWTSHRNKAETAKLISAMEDKDSAAALEKAAGDTDGGRKALALLNAAAKHADKKEFAKAAVLYNAVETDSAVPSDLRDLAAIYHVRAAMLENKDVDYKALGEKLSPIAKNDGAAFQLQAKLDAALLYGDGLKDYTAALSLLSGFDGEKVSASLKEKANALKHVYMYEQSQNATPSKTSQPTE